MGLQKFPKFPIIRQDVEDHRTGSPNHQIHPNICISGFFWSCCTFSSTCFIDRVFEAGPRKNASAPPPPPVASQETGDDPRLLCALETEFAYQGEETCAACSYPGHDPLYTHPDLTIFLSCLCCCLGPRCFVVGRFIAPCITEIDAEK